MLLTTTVLAFLDLNFVWHALGVVVFLLSVVLILVIMVQDSKGAGLTSAFGAGPGGESLLGARMQRDIARYTSILATGFVLLVISMGLLGNCRLQTLSAGSAGAKPKAATTGDAKAEDPFGGLLTPQIIPGDTATPVIPAAPPAQPTAAPSGVSTTPVPQVPAPAPVPTPPAPTPPPVPAPQEPVPGVK